MGLADQDAIALYEQAIEMGVTYFDTAPGYGSAQRQLSHVLRGRRDELFIATKVPTADGPTARRMLEENLRDLETDHVDVVYVHSLGGYETDEVLGNGGALAALRQAQREGLVRYVGFTAHNRPWKALRVLHEAAIDVVMLAMNFADRFTYGFESDVLQAARDRGVGVVAMKVYGGATGMEYKEPISSALKTAQGELKPGETGNGDQSGGSLHRPALRYAMGLPGVASCVVGVYSADELMQNLRWVTSYEPLSEPESARLAALGRSIADRWGAHYGPVE
jgi:hypothetical protein